MPVVVVTGARQTGKSTLALNNVQLNRRYETLDDIETLALINDDPMALLDSGEPITLDEVQRVSSGLLAIKQVVGKERINGQFLLTGSANLLLMQRVAESLAGRASY